MTPDIGGVAEARPGSCAAPLRRVRNAAASWPFPVPGHPHPLASAGRVRAPGGAARRRRRSSHGSRGNQAWGARGELPRPRGLACLVLPFPSPDPDRPSGPLGPAFSLEPFRIFPDRAAAQSMIELPQAAVCAARNSLRKCSSGSTDSRHCWRPCWSWR
jgi:hypothetical protein